MSVFCCLSLTYGIIFALPAWLVFSPNLPSPVIQSASCDVSFWPWCVEVRVLQETDKAAEGLLCPVLPRTLLHGVPPHLCPGGRRSHAPRRLALHCLCDLPQAPSTRHHWGMGHRDTATQKMSHEAGTTAAVSFPSCSFQNTHTHKQCSCCLPGNLLVWTNSYCGSFYLFIDVKPHRAFCSVQNCVAGFSTATLTLRFFPPAEQGFYAGSDSWSEGDL